MTDPNQQRITDFWSFVAPGYEAHGGNVPVPRSAEEAAWTRRFREWLPGRGLDVLDLGTGTGFAAIAAARIGHRVTAIDLSEAMLAEAVQRARAAGVQVAFQKGDGVAPPFAPESFDAITCRHFLWTLREPAKAFRNWRRLLKPSGRIVAIDGFWFPDRVGEADSGPFGDHYTAETRAALPFMHLASTEPIVACLSDSGFGSVSVDRLADVHALADDPPGTEPWYVLVAQR